MKTPLRLLLPVIVCAAVSCAHQPSDRLPVDGTRNLALLRPAYASSSYDYNLTAQLATDGIIGRESPAYIALSTADGPVARNEREWIFDQKIPSALTVKGPENYLELSTVGYTIDIDRMILNMDVESNGPLSWTIAVSYWSDGQWVEMDRKCGTKWRFYEIFKAEGGHDRYKVALEGENVTAWKIRDWDFAGKDFVLEPVNFDDGEVYSRENIVSVLPSEQFRSAWMSAEGGQQWIYVDLGERCNIVSVHPIFGNVGASGKVQFSDDAVSWKDVADIDGANEVSVRGKARYVRLALDGGDAPYVLNELEILGTGGYKIAPKPQPEAVDGRLALTGGQWKLQRSSLVDADAAELSTAGFDDEAWMNAKVPGTVLTSYLMNEAIPDPNWADNQLQISESYFNSDFWYRDEFIVPEDFAGKHIFLNFDAISWKAEIYLNGQQTGRIDGSFMRGCFDVTDLVRVGEINSLAVKVIRPAHPGAVKEQTALSADSNGGVIGGDNPSFHASIGWDWIPTIRGRETGIWNDVYLTATGPVTISDPFVHSTLNLPDTTMAEVFVQTDLVNHSDKAVSGTLHGTFGEYEFSHDITVPAGETANVTFDPIVIDNPALWWPNGYGEQNLYDVRLAFDADGVESDSRSFRSGIRQMTFNEDGGTLTLFVNGRRFVGKGGSWGFSESNLAYTAREYDIAVRYHAEQNFTMIRNWVGQVGDEEFYDACDRYGIMVWQDFWLANPWDGPNPYDEAMFLTNAEDYVRRIRNHASIGIYVGRNEGYPTASLDKGLREIVGRNHPGIHFISDSADDLVSGRGPYRALPVKEYFNLFGSDKFHSERGMPCVMNIESLRRTLPEENLWPQNSMWGLHDFCLESAQSGQTFNQLLEDCFGWPESAEEFTTLAQWINYDGYRAMFEGRSDNRRGLLLWMSHPAWPSMVWQTYDFFFDPTAAYFGCKKACEPLHIQYNSFTGKVEVVNVSAGSGHSLVAQAKIVGMDGKTVWTSSCDVLSDEDTTVQCFDIEVPEEAGEVYFIKLELSENGGPVSDNFYWKGCEEGNCKALRGIAHAKVAASRSLSCIDGVWKGQMRLVNNSDVPALMIRLKAVAGGEMVLPVIYSDNYFSLLPGEEKLVDIEFADSDIVSGKPDIELSGFNI